MERVMVVNIEKDKVIQKEENKSKALQDAIISVQGKLDNI